MPREAMMDAWSDIRRGIPFRLLRGDTLLGTLAVHEAGPEWLVCAFDPTAAFAPIHPLFDTTSGTFADPPATLSAPSTGRTCAHASQPTTFAS